MNNLFKEAGEQRRRAKAHAQELLSKRNEALDSLWNELQKMRGELGARGIVARRGFSKSKPPENCIILSRFTLPEGRMGNAITFDGRDYLARGGREERWEGMHYFESNLGSTARDAALATARAALDKSLPAYGNVFESGWYITHGGHIRNRLMVALMIASGLFFLFCIANGFFHFLPAN